MKKSLLALAVLGAFAAGTAQAQTNVSIGGVIRAQVKDYKVSSSARVTKHETRVDDDWTSRFWLTGNEDLGGGLSALFYVENRFNTDVSSGIGAANGLGNGDTFVGLKGGWGQVTLGKHTWMATQGSTTEVLGAGNTVAAIPTAALYTFTIFDQQTGALLDLGMRRFNSITYRTPNISGFSGTAGYAASGAGGTTGINEGTINGAQNYSSGQEWFLQGAYANGPLYLNLAYWASDSEGHTGTNIDQARFSGSYKIAGFKFGAAVDRSSVKPSAGGAKSSRTAWAVPVSYGIGNGTIMASYAQAGDISGVKDSGAKMYTVGYDHALSKRTAIGAFYTRLDNDRLGGYTPFLAGTSANGSSLALGETASTFAVTLHHSF